MAAQIAQTSMGFVDTVMVGKVAPEDLAAVAMGTGLWHPLYLFGIGVLMATSTLVAHLHGAGKSEAIGPLMRQALWLSVLLSGPTIWLLCQMATVMRWLRVTPDVVHIAQGYLDALAWGVFPAFAFSALRFLCEGIGFTRPIMLFGIVGLVTNVGANYVLIYGKLGFPALGAVGCGLASALALWAMFGCLLAHVLRFHRYRRLGIFARTDYPKWSELKPLLTIGLPIGLSIFIEASIFGAIALILGVLGATVVAGHQIALNVASLSFMIPLSFAMATTVRVGQAAGRSDPRAARTCGFIGIAMALVTQMAMGLLIFTFAQPIAKLYSNDPSVIDVAVGLLTFAALFQISDGLQVSANGALRGLKDTRVPMLITILAYWVIGLPLGYMVGMVLGLGAPGLWIGLIAGLTIAAVLLNVRFFRVSAAA